MGTQNKNFGSISQTALTRSLFPWCCKICASSSYSIESLFFKFSYRKLSEMNSIAWDKFSSTRCPLESMVSGLVGWTSRKFSHKIEQEVNNITFGTFWTGGDVVQWSLLESIEKSIVRWNLRSKPRTEISGLHL